MPPFSEAHADEPPGVVAPDAEGEAAAGTASLSNPLSHQEGNVWQVASCDDLVQAVKEIAESHYDEAVIELTANPKNAPNDLTGPDGYPFVGVPGKQVTVRSRTLGDERDHRYLIYVGADMVGDVVFDNVCITGKITFANGHRFETTENCRPDEDDQGISAAGSHFGMLFGGGHRDVAGSGDGTVHGDTNLVLRGGIHFVYVFGGGYYSEVEGDTHVTVDGSSVSINQLYGGGLSREIDLSSDGTGLPDGAKADGNAARVHGGTHVHLSGATEVGRLFGGGCESNVEGSTEVTLDSASARVQELYGGGMAQDGSGGRVGGDTQVTVVKGEVCWPVAGGANWSHGSRDYASVAGTARMTFGAAGAPAGAATVASGYRYGESALDTPSLVCGGSVNSTVGDVELSLLEGTRLGSGAPVFGCGASDTVRGAVSVIVDGAEVPGVLWGGGLGYGTVSDQSVQVLNRQGRESAVSLRWEGGVSAASSEAQGIYAGSQAVPMTVQGAVAVQTEGVGLDFVSLGNVRFSNDDGSVSSDECEVRGDAAAVLGASDVTQVIGNACSARAGANKLVLKGGADQGTPQMVGQIVGFDAVTVAEGAQVRLEPAAQGLSTEALPLQGVGDLELAKGAKLTVVAPLVVVEDRTTNRGTFNVEGTLLLGYGHQKDALGAYDALVSEGGVLSVSGEGDMALDWVFGNVRAAGSQFAFAHPFRVKGNWAASDTTVSLPAVADGDNYTGASTPRIPLRIDGIAQGATRVVVRPAGKLTETVEQKPVAGDNYLVTKKGSDETAFSLVNSDISTNAQGNSDAQGEGLFLSHGDDLAAPSANDRWFIDAGAVAQFSLGAEASGPLWWSVGASAAAAAEEALPLPSEPTREGYRFKGWNTKADGTGEAFAADSRVCGLQRVYAQWEKIGGEEPLPPVTPTPDPEPSPDPSPSPSPNPAPNPQPTPDPAPRPNPSVPDGSKNPTPDAPGTSQRPTPGTSTGVVGKRSLDQAAVSLPATLAYHGKALTPTPVVTWGGLRLRQGIDYTVSFAGNKKVGTAKVVITGKGRYRGVRATTFRIVPKAAALKKLVKARRGFTVTWKKPTKAQRKQITGYQIRYSLKKSMKGAKKKTIKASSSAGKRCRASVSRLKGGKTYYVQVRTYKKVKGKTYYSAWSKKKAVKTKR